MPLNEHEEAIIRTFFASTKRERYVTLFGNPRRRQKALNDLNHFHDFDPRHVAVLLSVVDVYALLQSKGAPEICHVISDIAEIDGRDLPLEEVLETVEIERWGTLIGCIPGQLAYYCGEDHEQRLLLEKKA